nr:ROK family protein [Acidobacteriota bacterium]
MSTLAIDIGGTKFSLALFEDGRMTRRESYATDREQGREWMLRRIAEVLAEWKNLAGWKDLDRCGIGFGGPVDFQAQRVALSTHVGGWRNFDLPRYIRDLLGVPTAMD